MKFTVSTCAEHYSTDDKKILSALGFTFKANNAHDAFYDYNHPWRMTNKEVTVHLFSLVELMNFIKKYGGIILDEGDIRIYDGYQE